MIMIRNFLVTTFVFVLVGCGGEGNKSYTPPKGLSPNSAPATGYDYYGSTPVGQFKDDAQTNTKTADDDLALKFVDKDGKPIDLTQYRDKKNVLLVVMRGFAGMICPNCTAQTSRLIKNHEEFRKRDAEVLVVYPGPTEKVSDFVAASRTLADNDAVQFQLLLDADFTVTDKLGIRGDLAKPSTYILDKKGKVRFAYVGSSTSDRPSIKAMLTQLDNIAKN